jgi:1-acyl-sn-glycerol-3-phosphate acyltransferase
VISARVRLALLWVSQVARVVGDWCLRLTTVLALRWTAGDSGWHLATTAGDSGWYWATTASIAPFVLLAPLNGCLSNGLPRRVVLVGASAFTLAVLVVFAAAGGPWLPCLAVVALGSAVYSPARYAVLPAAATDARVSLPRVNGIVEMGGAAAIVGGVWLGIDLCPTDGPPALSLHTRVVQAILWLNLLCLLTSLGVRFPSDVLRPEPPMQAVAGFFRDSGRIYRKSAARVPVLGLAAFQALVTAGSWPLIKPLVEGGSGRFQDLLTVLAYAGIGAALGCLVAGLQGNARRSPGLVPYAATGLIVVLLCLMGSTDGVPKVSCLLLGVMGGLINVPLRAAYIGAVPADARGNGMSVMNTAIYVMTTLLSLLMLALLHWRVLESVGSQLAFLAGLSSVGAAAAWYLYMSQALENIVEVVLCIMYRIRAHGPGAGHIPTEGPLILVANHAAYLDPFWIFKIVPRQVRPLMTSVFFDIPGVSWMMRHLIQAIRVEFTSYRREAPELKQVVAILRDGGCVLVFPEARLRRSEGEFIRRFGQGVWHVLQDVPETKVMVCWIEGGWGSWMSYYNGSPGRNKRPDFRRHIDIAVEEAEVVPTEVRADQWRTRQYLMRRCLECRRYLGLPVPVLEAEKLPGEEKERETTEHTENTEKRQEK